MSYQTWTILIFSRKNSEFEVHAVPTREIDTPFSSTAFENLEMGGSVEEPIQRDDEKDRAKLQPTTPVPENPNRHTFLLSFEVAHLKQKMKMLLTMLTEICFKK